MSKEALTLKFLESIAGGVIPIELQDKLDQAARDCADRPGIEKPRKVVIELCFTPEVSPQGELLNTKMEIISNLKLPGTRIGVPSVEVVSNKKDGTAAFKFRPSTPHDYRQGELDDADPDDRPPRE